MSLSNKAGITILYDGDCPVCSRYVTMVRLRESVGEVILKDAREHLDIAKEMQAKGFNIDDGMLVFYEGESYYGEEAVHIMSLLSTSSGVFNKINAAIFKRKKLANMIYPVLVFLRKVLLKVLRRSRILSDK